MGPVASDSVAETLGTLTVVKGASVTEVQKDRAALKEGEPVTATRIVTRIGDDSSVGVQVKTPVDGSILAPAGAPGPRLKVKVRLGSGSGLIAEAVKVSVLRSRTDWLPIGASTGLSAWI